MEWFLLTFSFEAHYQSVDEAAASDTADDCVEGDGLVIVVGGLLFGNRGHLCGEFTDNSAVSVPDWFIVKRMQGDLDHILALPVFLLLHQDFPHVLPCFSNRVPILHHIRRPSRPQPLHHQRLRGGRQRNCARVSQVPGCADGSKTRVSARRGVKMHRFSRVARVLQMGQDLVTHCTGLEGAAGLDVLQLEENPAACRSRKRSGFHQGCFDPWCWKGWLCLGGGDASHVD